MIYKESDIRMIFWDKIAKINIYICNCTAIKPEINKFRIIPYKIWNKKKSSINHIYIWEYKCYVYNNLRLLSVKIYQNKLMDGKKIRIFLEYNDRINRQYYIYILDTGSIIHATIITFNENIKSTAVSLY